MLNSKSVFVRPWKHLCDVRVLRGKSFRYDYLLADFSGDANF